MPLRLVRLTAGQVELALLWTSRLIGNTNRSSGMQSFAWSQRLMGTENRVDKKIHGEFIRLRVPNQAGEPAFQNRADIFLPNRKVGRNPAVFCGCRWYSGEQNGFNQMEYFRIFHSEILLAKVVREGALSLDPEGLPVEIPVFGKVTAAVNNGRELFRPFRSEEIEKERRPPAKQISPASSDDAKNDDRLLASSRVLCRLLSYTGPVYQNIWFFPCRMAKILGTKPPECPKGVQFRFCGKNTAQGRSLPRAII